MGQTASLGAGQNRRYITESLVPNAYCIWRSAIATYAHELQPTTLGFVNYAIAKKIHQRHHDSQGNRNASDYRSHASTAFRVGNTGPRTVI